MRDLVKIRTEIDAINHNILDLLNQRALLALEVRTAKEKTGALPADYYRPERELSIIHALIKKNKGPLRDAHVKHIFQAIMASSLALQQALKVAYLGPKNSESHQALNYNFGLEVDAVPQPNITKIIHVLEANEVEFAVVPLEKADDGMIVTTIEALINSSLRFVGEIVLNSTRFVILGKTIIPPTGHDKTSMLVTNITNEPGALFRLVEPFHHHQINISLPALRPSKKGAWNYIFYLDAAGHEEDPALRAALTELHKFAKVKILGSYPLTASIC